LSGKLEAEHCLKPWQAPDSMQATGPIGAERRNMRGDHLAERLPQPCGLAPT
jgi:hypothetical protein